MSISNSTYRFLRLQMLCLIALLSHSVMFATDSDSLKTFHIDEITITEQYRNTETRSSSPLQIISSSQLAKLNVLQVSDAVKHFSGVSVKDYGGIGGLKTISVRSLGAAHTAVSYDGIAISDVQTGQIDIGRFSLDNVDILSLHNGQSDNIFQPARLFASASLLNIHSNKPSFSINKSFNGKASLKAGSFGFINPSFLYNQRINNTLSASLSGEWLSAHGEYPYILEHSYLGDGTSSLEKRKNSNVQNFRIETALHAAFSDKESAYLKLYFYNSERGLPGGTILYNEGAFTSQRVWDNTFFVQSHYEKDFSQKLAMQVNAKYHHGYLHYLDTVVWNSYGYEESVFKQNEYYLSASALYRAFPRLSFSFSTDAAVNTMLASFENEALTNEFAKPLRYSQLSVLAAKYVDEHFLATGSLLSTIVTEKVAYGNAAPMRNRLSPYISLTYKPFSEADFRIRAFYKNIFRLPTFNDLYYARIGNAELAPENTDQFNIGLTYSSDFEGYIPQVSFSADIYRNYVRDKIIAMPTKNLFNWTMVNLGKVEITGLDLNAETKISLSEKTNLVIGGTYTYQKTIDITEEGNSTYGHQIPYTPRVSGSGSAALETPWIDLAYSVLWSGKRYVLFQNYAENRLEGYSDHSVSASKDIKLKNNNLYLSIEVLNLLDENYAIVKWFPMPGRSLRANISFTF